jgi:hypothetical protein
MLGRTTEENNRESSTHTTPYTQHIIAPILAGTSKTLAMTTIVEKIFPALPNSALSLGVGAGFGAINFAIQHHYITKLIHLREIHIIKMTDAQIEALSTSDEGKAFLILISSLSSGFIDACKAYLKTSGLDPRLSFAFMIQTFLTQQATHVQAMGQKWLGESGVNINNTWAGKIANTLMLDFNFIKKYFFDLKSLVTKLYPSFEAALQFATVLNFGALTGLTNPLLLLPLATYATYSQYLLHKGLGQEIMQQSLNLEKREHALFSSLFESVADFSVAALDHAFTLPCDLLATVFSPDAVVKSSNVAAGAINGYMLFTKALTHPPKSFATMAESIHPVAAGLVGASVDAIAQTSRLSAAWDQKIIVSGAQPENQTYQIGVKSMLKQKFTNETDTDEEQDAPETCTSRVTKRITSYLSYMQEKTTHYASSLYGLFPFCKKTTAAATSTEVTPLIKGKPNNYQSI